MLLFFIVIGAKGVFSIADPSAVYCNDLGFRYIINHTTHGDEGLCVFEEDIFQCNKTESGEDNCTLVKEGKKCDACHRRCSNSAALIPLVDSSTARNQSLNEPKSSLAEK